MFSNQNSSIRLACGLSVLLAIFLIPTASRAEQYSIRNDLSMPVVVQATCIFQGKIQQDRPYKLQPKMATPFLKLFGNKVITVYDFLMPTRVLYRGKYTPTPANLIKLRVTYDQRGRITLQHVR